MKLIKSYENFNYDVKNYRVCNIFTGDKRRTCLNINHLRSWIIYDLGFKKAIDGIRKEYLDLIKSLEDRNPEYQEPLSHLYKKQTDESVYFGIERRQTAEGIKYYTPKFDNQSYVKEGDKWHFVNKLNTNYSDLSELLTEIIHELGIDLSVGDIKTILLRNKTRIHRHLRSKYNIDKLKEYVRNTKVLTHIGNIFENYAESILSKMEVDGVSTEIIHNGGDGDLIDMIFGVDIITKCGDKIVTYQVKSSIELAKQTIENYQYNKVDYFIAPVEGLRRGIMIFNKNGESYTVNNNGEIVDK